MQREPNGSAGSAWLAALGILIGLGLIALALVSWRQVNEYAAASHAPGVTAPPLAEFFINLAKPIAPLFEGSSGKGSPAALAKAIQVVLGAVGALGAGAMLVAILGRNAAKSGE